MGRIIAALAISVDGYAEGSGGDLSVMPMDEAFNIHNAELIAAADRLIYGADTYRMMVAHWPNVLDDPNASDAERNIAQRCADGIPIIVISDSLTVDETGPWRQQTTIIRRSDAARELAEIRESDETAVIFGSQALIAALLETGLLDQLSLMIGPKLVAGDRPVFTNTPATELTLRDVTRYPDSDNIVLDYDVVARA
ncbi:dihydrofolate reductase family protein [Microbacterium invictum]|uniref:Dihydrofolate reductase family protein n=1 Tax=Microbacterium invictum TaxID=515415 RepID=A0ABZ0VFD6_9MICO|nr:dihydrofolate reductase family protein [Microbacterium invictum]WQB70507.1 dihydrofolate reductase family protein [Microbacterium invictum]